MFKKETFRERILQLGNNKELAEIAGVSPSTMSKYLNSSMSNIPTADILFNIAEHYNISIDWLVGKTEDRLINDSLSPSDACKALVSICESFPDAELKKFSKKETCFDMDIYRPNLHFVEDNLENDYIYLSFPGWAPIKTAKDRQLACEYGNCLKGTFDINHFLLGYSDLRNAKNASEFLTPEHYSQIIDEQLETMKLIESRIKNLEKRLSNEVQ